MTINKDLFNPQSISQTGNVRSWSLAVWLWMRDILVKKWLTLWRLSVKLARSIPARKLQAWVGVCTVQFYFLCTVYCIPLRCGEKSSYSIIAVNEVCGLDGMYELWSYHDNGFIIDELRYIISSMTFIMTPSLFISDDIVSLHIMHKEHLAQTLHLMQ